MSLSVKTNLVAVAVAAALASGSALAAAPSVFYAGGGSAQANAFFVAACRVATGVDLYTTAGAGTLDGSYYILSGTLTQAIGSAASGTAAVFVYKFNGGSYANGIAPQTTSPAPTTLPYPNVTNVLAAGTGAGNACTTGLPTVALPNAWSTYGTVNLAPDFGLSDVEVPLFQHFNNPTGNDSGKGDLVYNSDGGAAPTVGAADGIYDNLFGVAVTADIFNGTGNSAGHPKTNFTRAEVEGILSGSINNFSQLYADDGTQLPAATITFLDRGEGSGTKASGNQYFLGYPGNNGSVTPYSAATTGEGYCNTGGAGGTTSGGISNLNCDGTGNVPPFTAANPPVAEVNFPIPNDTWETSTNALIADLLLAQQYHVRAIGILGLENPPAQHQVGGVNQYYFASINGVPVSNATTIGTLKGSGVAGDDINGAKTTYNNVITGQYDFYFQNSLNTRSSTLTAFATTFKNIFKAVNFNGCNFGAGGTFPAAAPGTLSDADFGNPATTKGATLNTRNKVSSAPLQASVLAAASGVPLCTDTL